MPPSATDSGTAPHGPRFSGPTIMMCPPDFYGIEYEINPWMNRSRPADRNAASTQWNQLRNALERAGAEIRIQDPVPGLPDLVFTANAGLVFHETVFLSRFRHAARQAETPVNTDWFAQQGFRTQECRTTSGPAPALLDFEGAGDALFCGETLFAGYSIRSDVRAEQWLAEQVGCRVIPLQLVDQRFYHLDTCFCPLTKHAALWFPAAFDHYGQLAIRESIPQLITVCEAEAERFACNAVVVGQRVTLNTGCPRLEADLQAAGFTTLATPLDEFLKAGGSAKCLTLRLDGEDAASWRT